jgi:hypothetical protein
MAEGDTGVSYREENPSTIIIKNEDLKMPPGEMIRSWGRCVGAGFK